MRNLTSLAACAVLALGFNVGCTTSDGPTIQAVTPSVTTNTDGTYSVSLIVDFNDSVSGDLVDAYTFQTDDGQVDDVDVALPAPSSSPFTLAGLILPADYAGHASLGFHLALYGANTGLGSTFDGVITIN